MRCFLVSCGGSDNNSSGGSSGSYVCSYGNYECRGGDSYFCGYSGDDLMWLLSEECSYGCEYGKCVDSSDSGSDSSNNNDNSSECTSGKFKCVGNESHYCNSNGSWVYDARCENGCDSSTGKCKTNSGDNEDPSNDLTCVDEGSYRCYDNLRQQCDSGTWKTIEECDYLCNPTTQECEDDKGCKSGEYKCIGLYLNYCNNDFWEIKEKCQFGCDSSTKKCIEGDCTPGEYICGESQNSGYAYGSYLCVYGQWTYNKTCPNECDKSTGKCEAECTSGKYTCSNEKSMLCKDGFWERNEYCSYGCDSSTGKCKSPECTSGKYKCSNNNSMLCENGFWKNNESCTYGCNESTGECKTCDKVQIGNKIWSSRSQESVNWEAAKTYCSELTECGYSDWHLPTISELRTLIQNCSATQTGGKCKVTDSCLSSSCREQEACRGCSDSTGECSKLGEGAGLWSSSALSDNANSAWMVLFIWGMVADSDKSENYNVRCVR
ncbi:DUF1566 domain-containing protein [bacterium]|nr:DUF1566 domain-containing protein [bacterium]